MNKKLFLLLTFLFFVSCLYGNDIRFSFDIGQISFGGQMNSKEKDWAIKGDFLDFAFSDYESGFGMSFQPLSIYSIANDENEKVQFGLLNFTFFYDIFHFKKNIEIKPFFSIKTLNPQNLKFYNIEGGLRLSLYMNKEKTKKLRIEGLTASVGTRFTEGKFNLYFDIGMDLGILIYSFFNSEYEKAKDIFYN